ncbi:hypothetical protein BB561_004686 [Smittium simulii]|uniref:Threonylcarbamoyl-AMP synthase n=1 Tax=Smittium simulii TaxID=133385 RepID=A0A2T9YEV0_9FUNG|nr:hypothetical protein BB561_004686 [Smittium simulii]
MLISDPTDKTLDRVSKIGIEYKIPEWLAKSVYWLLKEETVVIPTETVYGLAANALSENAVSKIYKAKSRPSDNPLIVHVSSLEMLLDLYKTSENEDLDSTETSLNLDIIPKIYHQLVYQFWPGPLTIVLPRPKCIPDIVLGYNTKSNTVAFRLPDHEIARAIIELSGLPLAAPSANSSGLPSPTLAKHVLSDLDGLVPLIIDAGPCQVGLESTVIDAISETLPNIKLDIEKFKEQVDCYNTVMDSDDNLMVKVPCILRPGKITIEKIYGMINKSPQSSEQDLQIKTNMWEFTRIYGKSFKNRDVEIAPTTPGMKYRHYSPHAKVALFVPPKQDSSCQNRAESAGIEATKSQMLNTLNNLAIFSNDNDLGDIKKVGIIYIKHQYDWLKSINNEFNVKILKYEQNNDSLAIEDHYIDKEINLGLPNNGKDGRNELIACSVENILDLGCSIFGLLRTMDELKVELIMVEGVLEDNEGLAIMNRLDKAASTRILCK